MTQPGTSLSGGAIQIDEAALHCILSFIGRKHHQCAWCPNALARCSRATLGVFQQTPGRVWPICCPLSREYMNRPYPLSVYWEHDRYPFMVIDIIPEKHGRGTDRENGRTKRVRYLITEHLGLYSDDALLRITGLPSAANALASSLSGGLRLSIQYARGELYAFVRLYPSALLREVRPSIRQEARERGIEVCKVCLGGDLAPQFEDRFCTVCRSGPCCYGCGTSRGPGCVYCVDTAWETKFASYLRIRRYWFLGLTPQP